MTVFLREVGDVKPDGAASERQQRGAQQIDERAQQVDERAHEQIYERAQGPGGAPVEPGSQSGERIPLFLKGRPSFIQVLNSKSIFQMSFLIIFLCQPYLIML